MPRKKCSPHCILSNSWTWWWITGQDVITFVAGDETSLRHRVLRRPVRDEHPAPRGDDGRQVGAGAAQAGEQLGAVPVAVAHLQVVAVAALCKVALNHYPSGGADKK